VIYHPHRQAPTWITWSNY